MIINVERKPSLSLYYIGGIILQILKKDKCHTIDNLFEIIKGEIDQDLHIDFYYYALDWLFILSKVRLIKGWVKLCE
jgi:hypothetical protein